MSSPELSSNTVGVLERPQSTSKGYRRCVRCVMDTTDPGIRFDDQGRCNNCQSFLAARAKLPQGDEDEGSHATTVGAGWGVLSSVPR